MYVNLTYISYLLYFLSTSADNTSCLALMDHHAQIQVVAIDSGTILNKYQFSEKIYHKEPFFLQHKTILTSSRLGTTSLMILQMVSKSDDNVSIL